MDNFAAIFGRSFATTLRWGHFFFFNFVTTALIRDGAFFWFSGSLVHGSGDTFGR